MDEWSDAELEAAVEAYLGMLAAEQANHPYSKAEINSGLREGQLSGRTKGSVEYRMQNISAVLLELGHAWLPGYKPAHNVGLGVKQRLLTILKRHGIEAVEK